MAIFDELQKGVNRYNAENPDVVPAKPQAQPSNFACPTCDKGGVESRLFNNPDKRGLFCNHGHGFQDLDALTDMNPRKLSPPAPRLQPARPGMVDLKVRLSQEIHDRAKERFGVRLDSSLSALVGIMCTPSAFVVAGQDLQRLEERFQKKIGDCQTLFGLIFELTQSSDSHRLENETMKVQISGSKESFVANPKNGDMILNMGERVTSLVKERAESYGISPEQLVTNTMKMAAEQGWM